MKKYRWFVVLVSLLVASVALGQPPSTPLRQDALLGNVPLPYSSTDPVAAKLHVFVVAQQAFDASVFTAYGEIAKVAGKPGKAWCAIMLPKLQTGSLSSQINLSSHVYHTAGLILGASMTEEAYAKNCINKDELFHRITAYQNASKQDRFAMHTYLGLSAKGYYKAVIQRIEATEWGFS